MRIVFSVIVFLLAGIFNIYSEEIQIAEFRSSSYDGWEYNRSGFYLNASNIAQYKVTLFKESNGDVYTLTSPMLGVAEYTSLRVVFEWRTETYNQAYFDMLRATPTVELIASDGVTVNKMVYEMKEAVRTTDVDLIISTMSAENVNVLFSAPDADVSLAGAINRVKVYGINDSGVERINYGVVTVKGVADGIEVINACGKQMSIYSLPTGVEIVSSKMIESDMEIVGIPSGMYLCKIGNTAYKIFVK